MMGCIFGVPSQFWWLLKDAPLPGIDMREASYCDTTTILLVQLTGLSHAAPPGDLLNHKLLALAYIRILQRMRIRPVLNQVMQLAWNPTIIRQDNMESAAVRAIALLLVLCSLGVFRTSRKNCPWSEVKPSAYANILRPSSGPVKRAVGQQDPTEAVESLTTMPTSHSWLSYRL